MAISTRQQMMAPHGADAPSNVPNVLPLIFLKGSSFLFLRFGQEGSSMALSSFAPFGQKMDGTSPTKEMQKKRRQH
jgi:hypothetical protein